MRGAGSHFWGSDCSQMHQGWTNLGVILKAKQITKGFQWRSDRIQFSFYSSHFVYRCRISGCGLVRWSRESRSNCVEALLITQHRTQCGHSSIFTVTFSMSPCTPWTAACLPTRQPCAGIHCEWVLVWLFIFTFGWFWNPHMWICHHNYKVMLGYSLFSIICIYFCFCCIRFTEPMTLGYSAIAC